jgi:hypothetical protein
MTLRPTEPCADAADHADAAARADVAADADAAASADVAARADVAADAAAAAAHAVTAAHASAAAHAHAAREPLDPELERRIAALESGAGEAADFDAASWLWMVLLGIVAPLALLVWGWFGR